MSGTFSAIDWSAATYYLKTETDPLGGVVYTIVGCTQLLSVPYAMHATTAESVAEPSYTLGLNSDLGGYVFYITPDGKHGLVAATQDQSTSSKWYEAQDEISNPSNHNSAGKKFTDWRLPTKYELDLMYDAKDDIGGFAADWYWSSTESFSNFAWGQNFSSGFQDFSTTDSSWHVRAVRAF